jgi:hypothetical protein
VGGVLLTTEEKVRKNLSQGIQIVPAGTMKIHIHTIAEYMASQPRHSRENIKYPTEKSRLLSPPPKYSCPEKV